MGSTIANNLNSMTINLQNHALFTVASPLTKLFLSTLYATAAVIKECVKPIELCTILGNLVYPMITYMLLSTNEVKTPSQ
jgi:hypothetical protein